MIPRSALVVLDGWGLADPGPATRSRWPNARLRRALGVAPAHQLTAWGRAVGLPEGQMGNSEVGHLNLGAGSVVRQDLTRIDDAIEDGSFVANEVLRTLRRRAPTGRLHLLGLVSEGGVHALDHLKALIELAAEQGVPDSCCTPSPTGATRCPTPARASWRPPRAGCATRAAGWRPSPAATSRWTATAAGSGPSWPTTRSSKGEAGGRTPTSGDAAVEAAYERGETDEFVEPTLVGEEGAHPRRRRRAVLQLPARPRAPADASARRSRLDEFDRGDAPQSS